MGASGSAGNIYIGILNPEIVVRTCEDDSGADIERSVSLFRRHGASR